MYLASSLLCFEISDEQLRLLFQEMAWCNCPLGGLQEISPSGYGEIWGETNIPLYLHAATYSLLKPPNGLCGACVPLGNSMSPHVLSKEMS